MPYRKLPKGLSTSTICGEDWPADTEVMCSDRIPPEKVSKLLFRIRWPGGAGSVTLSFSNPAKSATGRICFDGPDGKPSKTIDGNAGLLLDVYGKAKSEGDADVTLKARIGGDERTIFRLGVGSLPEDRKVRVEPAPELLLSGTRIQLKAVPGPEPATEGKFRWVSIDRSLLRVRKGAEAAVAEIESVGPQAAEAAGAELECVDSRAPVCGLCVLFTPSGKKPLGVMAVYSTTLVESTQRWAKDLSSLPSREIKTGELVEMVVAIKNAPFRMDSKTPLAFYVLKRANTVGAKNSRIPARSVEFRRLAAGEEIRSAVKSFKAFHRADFYEQILVLEAPGTDYHVVTWWRTRHLGKASVDFLFEVKDRLSARSLAAKGLLVAETLTTSPIPPRIRLRLKGRVVDAHPLQAAHPEALEGIEVRAGGRTVRTGATGEYNLEGWFLFAPQKLELRRRGVEPLSLRVDVSATTTKPVTVTVVVRQMPSGKKYARVSIPRPAVETTTVPVNVADIKLTVHKIRGTVFWPDSRDTRNTAYKGTPQAGKRVYALPLAAGDIGPQRPSSSLAWAALKRRPGVHRSGRPGRFVRGERTDSSGKYEIKYIDLSAGNRYLLWAESLYPGDKEWPDYSVRTFYRELLELNGRRASNRREIGYHLIDHTFNMSVDAIRWGVESLKVVRREPAAGKNEVRILRPQRGDEKNAYDSQEDAGEELLFTHASRLLDNLELQCLPLAPIFEPADQQSGFARAAKAGLQEAMELVFQRGFFIDGVRFVLSAALIDRPGDPAMWCERLEQTYLVSPQIPSTHLGEVNDARWRCDAMTLADFARIIIPEPVERGRFALFANRWLDADWVPILKPVTPRITGLSAGRHLFLAPGHGFYHKYNSSAAANPAHWRSNQTGYSNRAGEDENVGYIAAEVSRIARRQEMKVSAVREIQDFTRPGVLHTSDNVFDRSNNPDFLRLWQQNPVYFLGAEESSVIINTPRGKVRRRDHNEDGVEARWRLAAQLAGSTSPIDLFLAIHTDANKSPNVRGVFSFWLDVNVSTANRNEFNSIGHEFARRLQNEIVRHCHLRGRGVRSLREHKKRIDDLQRTFTYSTRGSGNSSLWPRVRNRQAGWRRRLFPRTIPVALVEVGFHSSTEDAALLEQAWFRRLAGEALAFAVEGQLRVDPGPHRGPITQADLVRLLKANFGPTARIRLLVENNNSVGRKFASGVGTATGVRVSAGLDLDAAVNAVEVTQRSRADFVTALRQALAQVAGYGGATPAEVEEFVTRTILSGRRLADLSRPSAAITRAEAASFIALALGWSPATLSTVIQRQVGGRTLMQQLGGADHPDKFLPAIESQDLMTRIRPLTPEDVYRVTALFPADHRGKALEPLPGRQEFALRSRQRLTFVAKTAGIPWPSGLCGISFSLSGASRTAVILREQAHSRKRILSDAWVLPERATPLDLTVAITLKRPGGNRLTLGTKAIRILMIL